MMNKNLQVCLLHCLDKNSAILTAENFHIKETAIPVLQKGTVLCSTQYLSIDPYMHGQISGRHMSGSVAPGDVIGGETVSEVIESTSSLFNKGDIVRCMGGWQRYSLHKAKELHLVDRRIQPASYALSVLGMPGLTAYAGMYWLTEVSSKDTVLIPAATGAVGATAVQLAKQKGCRVIGIVGSEDKVRYAENQLGVDVCLNRNNSDISYQLDKVCPDGIDFYFDLVGGEMLNIASEKLAVGARVILCGLMSEYNKTTRASGPMPGLWIKARAKIYGLVVYDFENRRIEFLDNCLPMFYDGRLKMKEDIYQGLEKAPEALMNLMQGKNFGKVIVKVTN